MLANTDKTKCILITTFQKATRLPRTNLNIILDSITLDKVDSEKLLGVIVDKYLIWKHHVDKTTKNISKNIAILPRIKRYICPTKHFITPTFNPTFTTVIQFGVSPHMFPGFSLYKRWLSE